MTLHWPGKTIRAGMAAAARPGRAGRDGPRPLAPGAPGADERWQVSGDDGQIAGYGWLDSEWGGCRVTGPEASGPAR